MSDSQLLSRAFDILSPDDLDFNEAKFYSLLEKLELRCGLHFNKDIFVSHFQSHSDITRNEIFACMPRTLI